MNDLCVFVTKEIRDTLPNKVPFVQFKKHENSPYFTKGNTPTWVFFMFIKL